MKLKYISGLPLEEENNCLMSDAIEIPEVDIRTIEQAQDVLMEKVSQPKELYYIYRGLSRHADLEIFKEHNVRYDITVIPAQKIGKEFNKTIGHYHPNVPGSDVSYTEIYEVLHGKVHWLLQKVDFEKEPQEVLDVFLVEAYHGDKVVIPPGFGHISINPGEETLVMANIQASNFEAIYQPVAMAGGGVFFETEKGFLKNKKYKNKFKPVLIKAKKYEGFGFAYHKPMYDSLILHPEAFEFLTRPQKYLKEFEEYIKILKNK